MLFNSLKFLIFFPSVVFIYFLIPHRFRWFWLLATSCIFYMAFVPMYILILFGTIVIDYFAGILIEQTTGTKKKASLILSLIANIGVLCVFKYYNFFIENFEMLFSAFNVSLNLPLLTILLPIGLSFHTFQAMSYTIEVYRGNHRAERHFGIYALYVMFFPQLVAGPIERPQNMLHQFHEKHFLIPQNVLDGIRQMLWGFFKKVVIADRLSLYVDPVFNNYQDYHFLNLIIASVFFAFQIYADFSGYSDIALGSARIMGFNLMINFDRPFASKNVTEYWRKWHISLSSWLKDYLYTPIALNRRNWGVAGILFALVITMMISGLWHGAAWTFVIYGSIQGSAICLELLTKKFRKQLSKKTPSVIYNNLSILLTFSFTCFCLIFFRAHNISGAFGMIENIFSFNTSRAYSWVIGTGELTFNEFSWIISVFSLLFLFISEKFTSPDLLSLNKFPKTDIAISIVVFTLILTCGIFNQSSFIYFQF